MNIALCLAIVLLNNDGRDKPSQSKAAAVKDSTELVVGDLPKKYQFAYDEEFRKSGFKLFDAVWLRRAGWVVAVLHRGSAYDGSAIPFPGSRQPIAPVRGVGLIAVNLKTRKTRFLSLKRPAARSNYIDGRSLISLGSHAVAFRIVQSKTGLKTPSVMQGQWNLTTGRVGTSPKRSYAWLALYGALEQSGYRPCFDENKAAKSSRRFTLIHKTSGKKTVVSPCLKQQACRYWFFKGTKPSQLGILSNHSKGSSIQYLQIGEPVRRLWSLENADLTRIVGKKKTEVWPAFGYVGPTAGVPVWIREYEKDERTDRLWMLETGNGKLHRTNCSVAASSGDSMSSPNGSVHVVSDGKRYRLFFTKTNKFEPARKIARGEIVGVNDDGDVIRASSRSLQLVIRKRGRKPVTLFKLR